MIAEHILKKEREALHDNVAYWHDRITEHEEHLAKEAVGSRMSVYARDQIKHARDRLKGLGHVLEGTQTDKEHV